MSIKTYLKSKIVDPVVAQIKKGATPHQLALSSAFGFAVGIFPVYPTTTGLGIVVGLVFRLNHIALQAVNYALQPLQWALIPVYMRVGDKIFGAPPFSFSFDEIKAQISASPKMFFEKFGGSVFHGVVLWLITAPFIIAIAYYAFLPLFRKWASRHANK